MRAIWRHCLVCMSPLRAARASRWKGPPPAHVHGKNALGDVEGPQVSMRDEDNRFAHQLILDLVQAHPGEITIIAVGRLTNLALALRAAPHIAGLVKRIVVMGGAFGLGGPHGRPSGGPNGNVTPVAEANVFGDALAADEVLAASWPVTLVGLDATTKVVLTRADIEAMAGSDNAAVGFVGRAKRLYADYYARSGLDGCFVHDSSALICALQPQHFTLRKCPVTVVRGGPAHGQTLQVVNPGTYLAQDWFDRPAHDVATAADGERVREHFLRMMGQA